MTNPDSNSDPSAMECIYGTILGFMVPFFLAAAGGNHQTANAAVRQLVDAFGPRSCGELDLAGRIVGFSFVALDNLRLSVTPNLPDNKILRYRSNAVTLSRASDNARKMLENLHAGKPIERDIPRPAVAPAPPAPKPAAKTAAPSAALNPNDFDKLQREARAMLSTFSKKGAPTSAIMSDTGIVEAAATRELIEAVRQAAQSRSPTTQPHRNPMLIQGTVATTISPASTASR